MYGSLALADTFFEDYEISGTWLTYLDSNKTKALNKATKQIDRLVFQGERYQYTQDNEFPRAWHNGYKEMYFDNLPNGTIDVPDRVKEATYIQAKFLLDTNTNPTIKALEMGITRITVGRTSQAIDKSLLPFNTATGICREAERLLKPFLVIGY